MGKRRSWEEVAPPTARDLQQMSEGNYEAELLERLCVHYSLGSQFRLRWQQQKCAATGCGQLNLDDWHERFPDFPLYLRTATFTRLGERAPVSLMFRNFAACPFSQEYHQQRALRPETAETLGFGLVFRWPRLAAPGSPATGLALHDLGLPQDRAGVRLHWVSLDGWSLTLEPWPLLLAGLDSLYAGGKWAPQDAT